MRQKIGQLYLPDCTVLSLFDLETDPDTMLYCKALIGHNLSKPKWCSVRHQHHYEMPLIMTEWSNCLLCDFFGDKEEVK